MTHAELTNLLSVQVEFAGNDDDIENIERCVNASLIVDVFGKTFDGEYLLESLYEIGIGMDVYADTIESNLMLSGLYQQ